MRIKNRDLRSTFVESSFDWTKSRSAGKGVGGMTMEQKEILPQRHKDTKKGKGQKAKEYKVYKVKGS